MVPKFKLLTPRPCARASVRSLCVTCQVCARHWHALVTTPTSMMELCFFCDVAPSSSTAGLQEVPATEAATVICSVLLLEPDEVDGYTTMGRPPMIDALYNRIQQDITTGEIHISTRYTAVSALPRGTAHSARELNSLEPTSRTGRHPER